MGRKERIELIEAIQRKRNSKLITYVTSDRDGLAVSIAGDVVSIVHKHLLALGELDDFKLDFFIYSRGGESDVPWALVSMFREYAKRGFFSVLIPYRAHSAATVIALGADEIIMTKKAELGPIDVTMNRGPYNPTEKNSNQRLPISVEDVRGYFALLEKLAGNNNKETMKGFEFLTANVHPLALGTVNRLLEQTKMVGLRLLSTRARPFGTRENQEIITRLSSQVYSHSHSISRTEALKYLKLKQVKNAEDYKIEDDLWKLYEQYVDLFEMENPFRPEEYLITNDLEEHSWANLNLACIESVNRCHLCSTDMRVVRLRKVPPQVTLNLGGFTFPINLPALPANTTLQQIQALLNPIVGVVVPQTLTAATNSAVQQLMKSLPQAGFERIGLNAGWKEI